MQLLAAESSPRAEFEFEIWECRWGYVRSFWPACLPASRVLRIHLISQRLGFSVLPFPCDGQYFSQVIIFVVGKVFVFASVDDSQSLSLFIVFMVAKFFSVYLSLWWQLRLPFLFTVAAIFCFAPFFPEV